VACANRTSDTYTLLHLPGAIEFADAFPHIEVLGVDLSPIQPQLVPSNLKFEVDNLEDDWAFSHKFDFIFSRQMIVAIENWPRLVGQVYEWVNPPPFFESWPDDRTFMGNGLTY